MSTQRYMDAIGDADNQFNRVFDGGGYTVGGLYIDTGDIQGLFGVVGKDGVVKNLHVSGSLAGGICAGGLAGQNNGGLIESCAFDGMVSGSEKDSSYFIGGIVGANVRGTLINCHNSGTVFDGNGIATGGIAGYNSGALINYDNTGTVMGRRYVSDIAGVNFGTLEDCDAPGTAADDSGESATVE